MPAADETLNVEARLIDQVTPGMQKMVTKAKAGFNKMSDSARKFNTAMTNAFKKVVNLRNAIAGFVAVKGFQVLVGRVAELGDRFDKMSHRLQVSTDFLQELGHVAGLAGSSVQAMEAGIRKLAKSAQDADEGLETYKRSFDALGISVRDEQGRMKELETLFWEVTGALADVGSGTEKVALAQELLGRSGTALLPIVDAGSDAIKQQREEAHRLGGVLDKEAIKATVDYTDAMHRLNVIIRALQVKFIIPLIRDMADRIERFVQEGGLEKLERQVQMLIRAGKIFFTVYAVSKIMALVKAFKTLRLTIATLNPVMLGLTAGIIVLEKVINTVQRAKELTERFESKGWWDDPESLQKLLEYRKTFDEIKAQTLAQAGFNEKVAEALHKNVNLTDEASIENRKLAESIMGVHFATERGRKITTQAIETRLDELEALKQKEAEVAQKRAEEEEAARAAAEKARAAKSAAEAARKEEEARRLEEEKKRREEDAAWFERMQERNAEIMKRNAQEKYDLIQEEIEQEKRAAEIHNKLQEEKAQKHRETTLKRQENLKLQAKGEEALADSFISSGSRMFQAFIKNEKAAKQVALMASIIQGVLAVQRTLANPPGPPFTIPAAAAVGLKAAANTAVIASQSFQEGGFPRGQNALVRVNERGQESILNADATARLGFGGVNAMNSGQGISKNVTNQITYSPTITVEGEAPGSLLDELDKDRERFGEWLQKDVINRGYLN
jgi:hypothetical protein